LYQICRVQINESDLPLLAALLRLLGRLEPLLGDLPLAGASGGFRATLHLGQAQAAIRSASALRTPRYPNRDAPPLTHHPRPTHESLGLPALPSKKCAHVSAPAQRRDGEIP